MVVLPEVEQIYQRLVRELGATFTLDALIMEVAAWRGKRIHFEEVAMPVGITGHTIALEDLDLISVRRGLDASRKLGTQLHELAHLALGHLSRFYAGAREATLTYAAFAQARSHMKPLYRGHAKDYNQHQELAAEQLATLLLESILREAASMPFLARQLHGES